MATLYYKYIRANKIERLASIFKEEKIWASNYKNLNDPMEWFFRSHDKGFDKKILDEYKGDVKICCLSKSYNYGLMWAMYGDEHKGICLEVEVDETENIKDDSSISENYWVKYDIKYQNEPAEIKDGYPTVDEILKIKSPQWKHEQEVRFVRKSKDACCLRVKIKRVMLGVRTPSETKAIIYGMKSWFKLNFDIVDLASVGLTEEGVNYWKDHNRLTFKLENTSKNPIGYN